MTTCYCSSVYLLDLALPLRSVSIPIALNAEWSSNGVTVAGGHGRGNKSNQLHEPYGLCVDEEATVYIADWGNHRIMAWKTNATRGEVVAGGNGAGDGTHQLNRPRDVIVDGEHLFICDTGNERVVRWALQGSASGETILSNIVCWGLTMDPRRKFLYVSSSPGEHLVRRWQIDDWTSSATVVAGGNGHGNHLDQLNGRRMQKNELLWLVGGQGEVI